MHQTSFTIQICSYPGVTNDKSHWILNWRSVADGLLLALTLHTKEGAGVLLLWNWVKKLSTGNIVEGYDINNEPSTSTQSVYPLDFPFVLDLFVFIQVVDFNLFVSVFFVCFF